MSLYINQTGQPGKEAVPGAWTFRLTTAGVGHFREEDGSRKNVGETLQNVVKVINREGISQRI